MKWWEKTVEYFFIQKYVPEETILSPLDGKQELGGDALLSSDSQNWVIIEFKKALDALDSEKKKYKDYTEAKEELEDEDSHHFLVYGQVEDNEFTLKANQYFSRKLVKIDDVFSSGKPKKEFLSYLKKLIKHKSSGDESNGGTIGSYSFVAGISKNNKVTSCMNLYEFGLDHGLDLKPKPEVDMSYSGPSM